MSLKIGVYEKILGLMIVLSFALYLFLINQDISVLINKFLSDDIYYGYTIAKNIVEGKGVVFNNGLPTNGFHPFHMFVILVPLFKIFYGFGQNAPIYAALIISSLFSVLTAVPLYLIVNKVLNKKAALLSTFIWLFNPYVIFVTLMGLEPPIQMFFLSLLIYFILTRTDRTKFSLKESVLLGVLIGILFFSRMDGVFFGIGIITILTVRKFNQLKKFNLSSFFRLVKQRDLITILVATIMVVSPWFLWNLIEMGRLTPMSGEAANLLAGIHLQDSSYLGLVKHSIYSTIGFVTKFFLYVVDNAKLGILVLSFALLLPSALLLIKKDKFMLKLVPMFDFLIIGSILFYAFYWFYQLGIREWYSMYTSLLLSMMFPIMIIRVGQVFDGNKFGKIIGFSLVSLLVLSFVIGGFIHYKRGNWPLLILNWQGINYINENLPSTELVGSFNTGLYQYYAKDREVMNLDGVMNPEALEALKEKRIDEYILEKNVKYIIDPAGYVNSFREDFNQEPALELEEVTSFELSWYSYKRGEGFSTLKLFRVKPL